VKARCTSSTLPLMNSSTATRAMAFVSAVVGRSGMFGNSAVSGSVDEVHLAFTRFVNTLRQEPTIRRLLPLEPEVERAKEETVQYLFEPDPAEVMNQIVPRFIEVAVYQAILESKASQFSAQMVAMRNATDAAGDLIDDLTLAANKARQTRITKEMLEIASGAEAMKG
jgi:F-type H+-transporting ATPase subunit gamma